MAADQEKKEFRCKGKVPGTSRRCDTVLCLEDGAYIYFQIGDYQAEATIKASRFTTNKFIEIPCDECGYNNRWYRNK